MLTGNCCRCGNVLSVTLKSVLRTIYVHTINGVIRTKNSKCLSLRSHWMIIPALEMETFICSEKIVVYSGALDTI